MGWRSNKELHWSNVQCLGVRLQTHGVIGKSFPSFICSHGFKQFPSVRTDTLKLAASKHVNIHTDICVATAFVWHPTLTCLQSTKFTLSVLHISMHISTATCFVLGTMLQAGRSRVRVPLRWASFSLPIPSNLTLTLGSTQPLTEMSTRNTLGG
jgi:hypothetical protein